jgi:hypothetical protein
VITHALQKVHNKAFQRQTLQLLRQPLQHEFTGRILDLSETPDTVSS